MITLTCKGVGTFSAYPSSVDRVISQHLPNSPWGIRQLIKMFEIDFDPELIRTVSEAIIVLAHLEERQAPRTTP